jgi:hypothetical protein
MEGGAQAPLFFLKKSPCHYENIDIYPVSAISNLVQGKVQTNNYTVKQ